MTTEQLRIKQLQIGLEIRSDIERFLDSAVMLAKMLDTELNAVFITDQDILGAAALPMVHEVLLWTAKEQDTSTALLSRAMQQQAQQMEQLLAQFAAREAVPYSFKISEDPHAANAGVCALWVEGRCLPVQSELSPICVIDNGDEASQHCLQLAGQLCKKTGRPLKIATLVTGTNAATNCKRIKKSFAEQGVVDYELQAIEGFDTWLNQGQACYVLFVTEPIYKIRQAAEVSTRATFPILVI